MTECPCNVIMPYFLKTKIRETNQIITGSDCSVTRSGNHGLEITDPLLVTAPGNFILSYFDLGKSNYNFMG